MLFIELKDGIHDFVPGGDITGEAGWTLATPPEDATLKLLWYTEGRGTQDVGIVADMPLPTNAAQGRHPFRFQIPPIPYGFSGHLVSLKWAIELLIDNGRHHHRENISVSPWQQEPQLQPYTGDPH